MPTDESTAIARCASRREVLERFLAAGSAPCPACGTRLTETSDECCPHCGVRLALGLDRQGSGGATWLVGVLAAAVGSGFYVLTAPSIAGELVSGTGSVIPGPGLVAWAAGFLVTVGMLAGWILGRGWIMRRPRSAIIGASIATITLAVGCIAVLATVF